MVVKTASWKTISCINKTQISEIISENSAPVLETSFFCFSSSAPYIYTYHLPHFLFFCETVIHMTQSKFNLSACLCVFAAGQTISTRFHRCAGDNRKLQGWTKRQRAARGMVPRTAFNHALVSAKHAFFSVSQPLVDLAAKGTASPKTVKVKTRLRPFCWWSSIYK